MHELGKDLQHGDQPKERAEEEQRRDEHQAPLLAHQRREAREHELDHALRLAPAVLVQRVVAAQREAVQTVDQRRAVLAVRREGEALAEAPVALRHFLRPEGFLVVEKLLERLPLLRVRGLEGSLLHPRPAM